MSITPPPNRAGSTRQPFSMSVIVDAEGAQCVGHELGVTGQQRGGDRRRTVGERGEHQRPVGQRLRTGQLDRRAHGAMRRAGRSIAAQSRPLVCPTPVNIRVRSHRYIAINMSSCGRAGGTFDGMCGRYVSVRGDADLLAEFDAVDATDSGDAPYEPDYNVAPTKPVRIIVNRRRRDADGHADRRPGPPAAGRVLGARAVVGEGPLDRRAADQCAVRGPRDGARVPAGLCRPPLPRAGRRLVRVAAPAPGRASSRST